MADIVVRPAGPGDSAQIHALIRAVRINPIGLDWRRFLVAVDPDGVLIGCGQVKPHRDGSRELASIAVRPQDRGRGVARALIEALMAREPRRPLYLMCRSELGGLYHRFGFVPIPLEVMPPYFRSLVRIERLLNSRAPADDRLLVMRLDQG